MTDAITSKLNDKPDIVIIGSGDGLGHFIQRIKQTGRKVLVLEDNLPEPKQALSNCIAETFTQLGYESSKPSRGKGRKPKPWEKRHKGVYC